MPSTTSVAEWIGGNGFRDTADPLDRALRIGQYGALLALAIGGTQLSSKWQGGLQLMSQGCGIVRKSISVSRNVRDVVQLKQGRLLTPSDPQKEGITNYLTWRNAKKTILVPNHWAAIPSLFTMLGCDLGPWGATASQFGRYCWLSAMICDLINQTNKEITGQGADDQPYGLAGSIGELGFATLVILVGDRLPPHVVCTWAIGTGTYYLGYLTWSALHRQPEQETETPGVSIRPVQG